MHSTLSLPEDIGFIVSERFGNAKVLPFTYANLPKTLPSRVSPLSRGITASPKKAASRLSRGGSDLTGGEVAFAMDAKLYENWTILPASTRSTRA